MKRAVLNLKPFLQDNTIPKKTYLRDTWLAGFHHFFRFRPFGISIPTDSFCDLDSDFIQDINERLTLGRISRVPLFSVLLSWAVSCENKNQIRFVLNIWIM